MMEPIEFDILPYRAQVLHLHLLTEEEEQIKWLMTHKVLEIKKAIHPYYDRLGIKRECVKDVVESIADCAFRLRDSIGGPLFEFYKCLVGLFELLKVEPEYIDIRIERAQPINWIQAALLAKLESEGE